MVALIKVHQSVLKYWGRQIVVNWGKRRNDIFSLFTGEVQGNCDILVNEFQLQLCYYAYFRTNALEKDLNLLISLSFGLNSTTTVLLQGWIWHLIIHEDWYVIKNKGRNESLSTELEKKIIVFFIAYKLYFRKYSISLSNHIKLTFFSQN